jgi:hypothetical protein
MAYDRTTRASLLEFRIGNDQSPSAYPFARTPALRANHLESEPLLEGVEVAV